MRRLDTLDGMRGIAALSVLFLHLASSNNSNLIAGAYLAVDFFFMLSGFVIARTYEKRLNTGLPPTRFLWRRFIRLYPVIAIGIFLGALAATAHGKSAQDTSTHLIMQLLFIPSFAAGVGMFPLNGVQWSLLFEFLANVCHALGFRRLSLPALIVLIAAALVAFAWFALAADSVALGDTTEKFWGGIPRVIFSYCVGIAIYRLWQAERIPVVVLPGIFVIALLPAAFMLDQAMKIVIPGWIADLAVVTIIMPMLLIAGANARLRPQARSIAGVAGFISYPLYALHLPVLMLAQRLVPSEVIRDVVTVTSAIALAALVAVAIEPKVGNPRRVEIGLAA